MRGHNAGGATWKTRTYAAGRLPGMATGPHGAAIVHTLSTRGARCAAQLLTAVDPSEVLSAWTQDHLADSVLVGIPRGFIPITLRNLGRLPNPLACRPMIHAGALVLGGLCPNIAESVLQHCGALSYLLPLVPPTRLRPAAEPNLNSLCPQLRQL